MLQFTTINHLARQKLGISIQEYCLLDTIYQLSTNPDSPVEGWCTDPPHLILDFLDFPLEKFDSTVARLIDRELLRSHPDGHLQTSGRWYFTSLIVLP